MSQPRIPRRTLEAIDDYALRLRNALRDFRASDEPMWRRTQDGLARFRGMPLDHLPPRLIADVDRRFGAINAILAPYRIPEGGDYRAVSAADLAAIQDLIEGFAFDPE